jgi:hypothetical protein
MTTATKVTPAQQAIEFVSKCRTLGWKIEKIDDSVVTIVKYFQAGNRDKLVECDMEYYDMLGMCPHRGGSVWGTDCGGMGAISALNNGVFRMHKSGSGAKRFAAEVRKIIS